eukprot:CAMPEP_0174364722 /NCGR_PEP_ID=MMETSP0811_2-20130205/74130_1 /TAXON_ID=73025 ORGANISM="Eutreptiella gymnastica-like, Strain CCMP1594" /NCGR_SAMPLE_ID=MMETSP0811_2 /ASSEMBLY_ACC=CAM_ASM_000667 /LENGTH=88 /DNA_ID=CAMNT_0015504647 /DNA_START=38 /DNA_END=301 /DNA_ORIENTATION=+
MTMFVVRIWLDELEVDPVLLYSGNRGAKYTHVQRLLILNKSSLMLLHPLDQLALEPTADYFDMTATSKEVMAAALTTIRKILSQPMWT